MKKTDISFALAASLIGAACVSGAASPQLQPHGSIAKLSATSSPTNSDIAMLTSGDCTVWPTSAALKDQAEVSKTASGVCVTQRRAHVAIDGKVRLHLDRVFVVTDLGRTESFLLTPAARPELFGYCRVNNQLRSVWIQTSTGCAPNPEVLVEGASRVAVQRTNGDVIAAWRLAESEQARVRVSSTLP